MPVISLYRHGLLAGIPPMRNDHVRAPRGEVAGWTHRSTRENVKFLRSVYEPALTGSGYAVTLTVRDCPASHDDWHKVRRRFLMRLSRKGLLRCHWVTEWQRRGVPHLHCAVFFPTELNQHQVRGMVIDAWLACSSDYSSRIYGQDVRVITDAVGWFQYVAKHAARGVKHYQRSSDSRPAGWDKTGRVWGKTGDWPVEDPVRFDVSPDGYFRFRRIVQRWRYADARSSGDTYRIKSAKKMLQVPDRVRAEVLGVSEWINGTSSLLILTFLASTGEIVQVRE